MQHGKTLPSGSTDTSAPLRNEWIREITSSVLPYVRNVPEDISERLLVASSGGFPGGDTSHWVDSQGKFLWAAGEVVFGFGRHQGRTLRDVLEVDPQYLRWIGSADFSDEVKRLVLDALEGKLPEREDRS